MRRVSNMPLPRPEKFSEFHVKLSKRLRCPYWIGGTSGCFPAEGTRWPWF